MLFLGACGSDEPTVAQEVANIRAKLAEDDPPVFVPLTNEGEAFHVPSDPDASYRLLQWERVDADKYQTMIRRDGPSGTTFTRMLVDCGGQRYRVIGEGGSQKAALKGGSSENKWTDLFRGSIKDVTVSFVCRKGAE